MRSPCGREVLTYDIEVFSNFFMASFYDGKKFTDFFHDDIGDMLDFITDKKLVLAGFNNFDYDDTMIKWIWKNPSCSTRDIFEMSGRLIKGGRGDKSIFKIQYGDCPWHHSIDIFTFFNKRGSLKEWQCKEQFPRVVESAHDFEKPLPKGSIDEIVEYCHNDVLSTHYLLKKNWHLVEIRHDILERYNLGTRIHVVGEAGVAQMVFMSLHEGRTGEWISKTRENASLTSDNKERKWQVSEIVSSRVEFSNPEFADFLSAFECTYITGDKDGRKWSLDKTYSKPVTLGSRQYKLGVGGLHSVDGPDVFKADEDQLIIDLDVESYYPSLIITEKLYPTQMGPAFISDFTEMRDARLDAKHKQKQAEKDGDLKTAAEFKRINESLKIVINSTFGKLNDVYSPMRSVPSALKVCINGQLMLLMLIEMLQDHGADILSSNTDGVTIACNPRFATKTLPVIMQQWQTKTGHKLERADYLTYARRDVNAYVAVKPDGKIKHKGAFSPKSDSGTGKWDGIIVKLAAHAYFAFGTDPEKTVMKGKPLDFLYYQRVKNGGTIYIGDTLIGKIARWYVGKNGEIVKRKNPDGSMDSIPNGGNAVLALDVREWKDFGLPDDVDFDHYVEAAWKLINSTQKQEKTRGRRKAARVDEDDEADQ